MLGIMTCGGTIEYPDCSFCPMNNTTNDARGCYGDCQLNIHTNSCEFKGMLVIIMRVKLFLFNE